MAFLPELPLLAALGPEMFAAGRGAGPVPRPLGLPTPRGLLTPGEVSSTWSTEGCVGGVGVGVRACGFITGRAPQPTCPAQQAASSAEARKSALQSSQSERNAMPLPRGSRPRLPFRKGAAYWFPGARRLAERT